MPAARGFSDAIKGLTFLWSVVSSRTARPGLISEFPSRYVSQDVEVQAQVRLGRPVLLERAVACLSEARPQLRFICDASERGQQLVVGLIDQPAAAVIHNFRQGSQIA